MAFSLYFELLIIQNKTSSPKDLKFTRFNCIYYLVASSSTIIDGFLMRALAIAILCFWPPETVTPLSPRTVLYPLGNLVIKSCALAFFAASNTCNAIQFLADQIWVYTVLTISNNSFSHINAYKIE